MHGYPPSTHTHSYIYAYVCSIHPYAYTCTFTYICCTGHYISIFTTFYNYIINYIVYKLLIYLPKHFLQYEEQLGMQILRTFFSPGSPWSWLGYRCVWGWTDGRLGCNFGKASGNKTSVSHGMTGDLSSFVPLRMRTFRGTNRRTTLNPVNRDLFPYFADNSLLWKRWIMIARASWSSGSPANTPSHLWWSRLDTLVSCIVR